MDERIDKLEKELAAMKCEREFVAREEFNGALSSLRADIAVIRLNQIEQKADFDTLTTHVETLKINDEALKIDVGTLKIEFVTLNANGGTPKMDVATSKSDMKEIKLDLTYLRTELAVFKADVNRRFDLLE